MSETPDETLLSVKAKGTEPRPAGGGEQAVPLPENFGRYRVQKLLGKGGMGAVWLATDTQLQRQVALKVPSFPRDCPPEMLARFFREAQSAATLNHPNICPVYDVGQHDGIHYITMGYIEGRPLADYIQAGKEQPEKSVAQLIRKLALALHEAHQKGIIHRDLKPANVMVNQRMEPVVMDFGLARQFTEDQESRMTRDGIALGSPAYMSPEQVQGRSDLGPATDIYSLGVVMYELLTGDPPFRGNVLSVMHQITSVEPRPVQEIRPNVSAELADICRRMMAKQPAGRFASMREVAEALTAWLKNAAAGTTGAPLVAETGPAPVSQVPVAAPVAQTRKVAARTVAPAATAELPAPKSSRSGTGKRRGKKKKSSVPSLRLMIGGASAIVALFGAGLFAMFGGGDSDKTEQPVASNQVAQPEAPAVPDQQPPPQPAAVDTASIVPPENLLAGRQGPPPGPPPSATLPPRDEGSAGPPFPPDDMGPDGPFRPGPPGRAGQRPGLATTFAELDRNQDGALDGDELYMHMIRRADMNRDETLSEAEFNTAKQKLAEKLFIDPTEDEERQMFGNRGGPRGFGPPPRRGGRLGNRGPGPRGGE